MDCERCRHFEGYDDDQVVCEYSEHCIYEDEPGKAFEMEGIKIQMDATYMLRGIVHEVRESVLNDTRKIAEKMLNEIITDKMKEEIIVQMKEAVSDVIHAELDKFMKKTIKTGGGWKEPLREITREEYLAELVSSKLEDALSDKGIAQIVNDRASKQIRDFTEGTKRHINNQLSKVFNDSIRAQLSENIIQLLLANDTYKKLQQSMTNLIPAGKDMTKVW